ncbi:nuclease-related domain-containing protein [Streptomyces nigrescens]|uniref:NERD domain-containing protein n=1 Tax=Streptomyces nigrescens TaxID=1920 RepID=A0ABY7J7N6_STRNI|nr:nuclease-related domain-containing protein [Streptomyces nigrescens]WAU07223.1 NERD domain-containing protein [Streptomyces nigrescens]
MSDLHVSEWKRYGHDRVYVGLPDGATVAWLDRKSGIVTVLQPEHEAATQQKLASYLPAAEKPAPSPMAAADDLALNPPGEALRQKLREVSPSRFAWIVARLLRRKTEADSWRKGLEGERLIGRELARLARAGWQVLHSIPLPREVDIDHLLIGPGGVFCINTKHHRDASIWVGDDVVKVNHGQARPYVRKARHEALRAGRAISRRCGFAVEVQPALVFVGAKQVDVVPTLQDVRVIRGREVAALGPLRGALKPEEVELIYTAARDRRTWVGA